MGSNKVSAGLTRSVDRTDELKVAVRRRLIEKKKQLQQKINEIDEELALT
jgi:hypothetical protein